MGRGGGGDGGRGSTKVCKLFQGAVESRGLERARCHWGINTASRSAVSPFSQGGAGRGGTRRGGQLGAQNQPPAAGVDDKPRFNNTLPVYFVQKTIYPSSRDETNGTKNGET